jgi:hypothetical protein
LDRRKRHGERDDEQDRDRARAQNRTENVRS